MPRINDYVQLAAQTMREISADGETWRSFLHTASTLYKYSFYDQMMIYAQRPDATASASFELWTNTMRRYVRRGAKGIALLDMPGDVPCYCPYPLHESGSSNPFAQCEQIRCNFRNRDLQ